MDDFSVSLSESDSGFAYGIGGTFNVTDQVYIRGDYTLYDIEDVDADMFMLGIGVQF